MADLAVQRLGGLALGQVQPVEIHLVMTDMSPCLGRGPHSRATHQPGSPAGVGDRRPVEVVGFGPVPAAFVRDRLRHGTTATPASRQPWNRSDAAGTGTRSTWTRQPREPRRDRAARDPGKPEAAVWLRRLYTSPDGRDLVAMDSRRRTFTGLLRQFLVLRDQACRVPWCEAPIRAIDHATPAARADRPAPIRATAPAFGTTRQGGTRLGCSPSPAPGWTPTIPGRTR